MRQTLPAALLAALLAPLLAPLGLAAPPARADPACAAPAELTETTLQLPATAAALRAGRLSILALGSASILGPGTSGPQAAWPARLRGLLAARFPAADITLTVRGQRGQTIADAAATLDREIAAARPALVLWQGGTVEAVRGIPPDDMTDALNDGIDRIEAAGADVVLIDPQFSRFLRANADIEPYRDALRVTAATRGAPLLARYELTRLWADADATDLERATGPARIAAAEAINDCLARALASLIASGVAITDDGR